MTRADGAIADVRPEWVEEWRERGWAPSAEARQPPAPPASTGSLDIGTDSGEQFSDEQLRAIIEEATGAPPHHRTGRAKLIEMFNELNAKAAADGG